MGVVGSGLHFAELRHSQAARYALYLAGAAVAAGTATAVRGVLVEPRCLDVREGTAALPRLPAAWEGRRFALFGDPQVGGPFGNASTARRIVRRVIEAGPAFVLLAGDYLYDAGDAPHRYADRAAELFAPLARAGLPSFAVLGNHDYAPESTDSPAAQRHIAHAAPGAGGDRRARAAKRRRASYARRRGRYGRARRRSAVRRGPRRALGRRGQARDDAGPGAGRRAADRADAQPGLLPRPSGGRGAAGGGGAHPRRPDPAPVHQRKEWTPSRYTLPWPQYRDGWIEDYGQPGNRLYVNRGIGFSHIPVRIGCPPELTFFTLRSAL